MKFLSKLKNQLWRFRNRIFKIANPLNQPVLRTQEGGWISCEDALPPVGGTVLVSLRHARHEYLPTVVAFARRTGYVGKPNSDNHGSSVQEKWEVVGFHDRNDYFGIAAWKPV